MIINELGVEFGLTSEPQVCFDGEFLSMSDNKDKTFAELVQDETIEKSGEILIIDGNRKSPL